MVLRVFLSKLMRLWSSFIFLCSIGVIHSEEPSFKNQNFFIKDGYISRNFYHHHDDRGFTDGSQREVYELALEIAQAHDLFSVVDIGCGSGYKLMKYFDSFDTTGYEIEPTLSYLKEKYPHRKWINSQLTKTSNSSSVDLIICSDVVEHLVNPDQLLQYIDRFDFRYLVISTPDRDLLLEVQKDPQSQTGPPVNSAHVREWNFEEFEQYISQYFTVIFHEHSKDEFWGQVIVAVKK